MSYSLHIERPARKPISLSEWRSAVEATRGVRLVTVTSYSVCNPLTNETIRIQAREGDAEVLLPEAAEWVPAFRWHGNSASFKALSSASGGTDAVWNAAVAIATRLGAEIHGDGGEQYELNNTTGFVG